MGRSSHLMICQLIFFDNYDFGLLAFLTYSLLEI